MRSHRRRSPLEHVLLAGGVDDLSGLALQLAVLPVDTYGQVLVETDDPELLSILRGPARVTVHQVVPDGAPGEALARAVESWIAEWIPTEVDGARSVSLWVGTRAGAHVDALCPGIGDLLERL